MPQWIRCRACRLRHTPREDGRCPRCGAEDADADADAARSGWRSRSSSSDEPPPAPVATPPAPAAADAAPRRGRRGRAVLLAAALVALAAGVWWAGRPPGDEPPPDDASPVVGTFPGGKVTLADVDREIRSLPPGLKYVTVPYLEQVVYAIATRKALVSEATAAGLSAPRGPDRDRRLIRALLEARGLRTPTRREEAREHHRRYRELSERARGHVEIDDRTLATLEVDVLAPVAPPDPARTRGGDVPFFVDDGLDGGGLSCDGVIHAEGGWYMGSCAPVDEFLQAFSPAEILYLEATYGPAEGFLHRFAYDGRENPRILVSFSTAFTVRAMPPPIPRAAAEAFRARLVDVQTRGSVDPREARRALERVAEPLRHCLADTYWKNGFREAEGTLVLALATWDGRVATEEAAVEGVVEPAAIPGTGRMAGFSFADCVRPIATYGIPGTGRVRYTLRMTATGAPPAR